jgi:uncharacterized protein YceH (UPF0502 family)
LNSLTAACNQSSNRNPVVVYDERLIENALMSLKDKGATRIVHSVHNRATKYRHVLHELLGLETPEVAILAVLMLRGPQTLGELRSRTDRMTDFETTGEVEATLVRLATREEPLVVRLERQPGQKEARYAHLLCGEVVDVVDTRAPSTLPPAVDGEELDELRARVDALEERVRALESLLE